MEVGCTDENTVKTTLETSGEELKITLETSEQDVGNTLEMSRKDVQPRNHFNQIIQPSW